MTMGENSGGPEMGKWDKLKSWGKVQEDIDERLKNAEKYDDSITLYYGPQLYHTFRHQAYIKCMTHFTSNVGDVFVSHYRVGTQDHLSVWTLNSLERGAKYEHQRFNIHGEIKAFLFVPKHRVYMCFCSDLVMRIFTDVHSKCTETSSQQCLTTVRCMAYNRETDEVYIGGVGVLQKWKISGSEHSATAEPGPMFDTELGKDEWVIDIKIDTRNKQLMVVTYEGIFFVSYVTMKQTHHLQNRHDNSLRCCCFYKDREYFITGGGDGSIKVWNAVVFTQVHVFYGHHDVITGLQTHKTDPLLFSSSLDGSVQIWRMDNFTKFMRLDLAEKIYSIKLLAGDEFYCQTESQVRIYSLNQFYSLFAPVESSVYKLQLCPGFKGQPSKIIASTEDGSVRLFSPITGATLTIIYPMPTFQVLSCFAYSHEVNRLHSVLQNGEVLVFNCDTNPCKAVEIWKPETTDEEVLQLVQFTLGYDKDGESVTDTVILGGLRNGQICLLDASECVMIKNLQAHEGNITCMENSTDIGETGFKLLETSKKMATGGADMYIKIWELGVKAGRLYDNIVIQLLVKIQCTGMPEHISMYENTVSVSTCEDSDKGKLHMYRLDGHGGKEIHYTTLQHPQDEDHTEHITAIDKCPFLGLFATASQDGYIKVWNRHSQLIREMSFGEPMHGLSFANVRGDLLIGFQNHICTIPLTSYFPKSYLERINRLEFKDEYREYPVKYNHRIKASFDPRALPQYPISFEKRTEEKKIQEEEVALEDLEGTPREPDKIIEEEEGEIEEDDFVELPAVTINDSPTPRGKTEEDLKHRKRRERRRSRVERDGLKEELLEQEIERGYSAPVTTPVKKMKLDRMKEERRKSDTLYLAKLTPWERDLFQRNPKPIIATDGYIPNSVVRKSLGFKPPPTPTRKQKDTWTIESIKLPPPEKPVRRTQSQEEEDDHWEEVKARYLQFLNESSEDEIDVEISVPPLHRGRPNHGRGRGQRRERVVDSDDDDDDDLELDDSEAVTDADIFAEADEAEIIRGGSRKKVKARYLQFLDESSEGEKSSSDDSDDEPLISKPPRQGGGGRPRNAGRGRGKKKVRVVDSDDEDLEFDDSEPVEDTDIFPPGYESEISKSLAGGPMSLLSANSDLKGFKPFNWSDFDEVEEGRKSSSYAPWRKMQTMIRTSSTLSNQSTSSSKRGVKASRRSTPTTPKYELKSKKFDFHRVDLDMGTPERMRRSVGTRSRERTKSFRLTNMVVDEQSTSVTFKEGSKSGHRKSMLPAVDMDIIRHLMEEDFFPELHGTASFDSIMQNLIRLLDTEDSELHAVVCDYIMNIHRDIGIPDHYLDRIITKLTTQLSGDNPSLKRKGLRTLREIGGDRQDVLATILPRLLDSQEDIREEAKEVLAALGGVDNKDDLLDLMTSLGMTKPFNSKDDEEEALKALAMRLDVPFRSDSFNDWINNWVDDASSIYDSEPEINFDDVEKAWDGRQHKWKHESLCMTESASRASTRMRELSFLSKGSPVRGVSDLSGTVSIFDDYPSEFSQSDEENLKGDFCLGHEDLNQSIQDDSVQDFTPDVNDVVQDYDPDYTKKMLLEDLMKEYSDIRESDFEHEDENSENEMKMPRKGDGSKSFDSKKRESDEEIFERVIQDKVVLNQYDSPDGSQSGDLVENSQVKTPEKLDAAQPNDVDLAEAVGGTPIQEEEEIPKVDLKIEDLDRLKTDGQLSDRSSRSGRRSRHRVSDEKETLALPRQGFLTRDEPVLHQGPILQQKEGTTYSAEEEDWFDPRDPSLYRYYKNRYIRDKDNVDGKFNYKSMSKLFSKSQLGGGGEDADSQIGSMDSYSQVSSKVGETLSTNDSGIISIQDSGIGRDMSDSYSYKSHKASPFLSKEKIHTKVSSYKPRVDSHRKSNLSPVKSSSTLGGVSAKSSPREDADWMKFFETPTALERKRMEMVKKDFHEGKMKPESAAVINYISDGLPTLPGEAGLRLLKSVRVCGNKGGSLEKPHRIESIPGKLGVHTKMEDKGQSKYGILQMQWTTSVPVPVSHNTYSDRYSSMSEATSTLGGSGTINTYRSLPAIVEKYGNFDGTNASQILDDSDFPHAPAGIKSPDYRWEYPIPPPPAKESRISVPYIKKEHDRYCKYYSVVKKKMQSFAKKRDLGDKHLLPTVDIKKALPERLKLPKELTKLSRVSSVLFPPITLNQLISAR